MATFRLAKGKKRKDGTTPLRIRLSHNYTEAEVTTTWIVTDRDYNKKGELKNREILNAYNLLVAGWDKQLTELDTAVKHMTAKDIIKFLTEPKEDDSNWSLDIIKYAREDGDRLIATGHVGTGKLRHSAANSLAKFLGKDQLDANELTASLLRRWVDWINDQPALGARKKGGRAAALYIAQMKAVYNKAKMEFNDEDAGIVRMPFNPFSKVKVKEDVPEKRSVTIEQLKAIMALPDRKETQPNHMCRYNLAKNVFILSFFLMGMNAADLYNCPQQDGDRITYERTKTRTRRADKARISILIPPEAEAIIAKYRGKRDHYFSFASLYSTTNTFNQALAHGLKEVGAEIGVPDLQFYAARHTWATIAYNDAKVDKGVVSDALNHVDERMSVTDRYIRKDWSRIDEANRKVIDFVLHEQTAASDTQ